MINNNTTENYISQIVLPPIEDEENERLYLIKDKKAQNDIEILQSNLTSLNEEVNTLDTKVNDIEIPDISNLVTTNNLNNAVSNFITRAELDNNYVKWSTLNSNYSTDFVLNNTYAHTTNGVIDNATVDYTDVNNLYDNYAHIDNNNTIDNASINYTNIDNLYNNYAHINNGTIDNANINQANVNDLNTNYAHITNGTIDNASINYTDINNLNNNYAHINNGVIDNATIDNANVNNLDTNYAHITSGIIDNATIDQANVNNLNTNYAHIINGKIDNATIDQANVENLNTNYAHIDNGIIDNATINYANINDLNSNYAHIKNGIIDNARIDQANVNNLNTNYAHITNGQIDNARIDYGNINHLDSHYAHISEGVIDNATISQANVDQLDAFYAEIDMANVNNAWIENGVIKDAAISDAKIIGVSANKLTAGTIDASNVNVTNLRADNLVVTKINGQPVIGGYTLIAPTISNYAEKNPSQELWYEFFNNTYVQTTDTIVDLNKNYYTTSDSVELYDQNTIDGMFENINNRIDSQIEVWTIDAVPTLNNYPAEDWTTNELKDEHIGDICYVVNASSDYNGYTYRFAYDNTSHQYNWVLIQDNNVTAALGRIAQLESFNNQLVNWDTATDEGVVTVRNRVTALSGRIDKTVKSSIQLWYTKSNTILPNAPTTTVITDSTAGGVWTTVVPTYDATYPYYFYCWQYQYEDNTYGWSAVVYDQATSESEERARTGVANATAAQNTANANIKSNVQLWFTKSNTTAPDLPTVQVTNNNASGVNSYNRWNLVVPTYNSTYPYYYYCYQQQKGDGTYQWTNVVYDEATSTAMATAKEALSTFTTFEQTAFKEVTDTIDQQSTAITTLTTITENNGLTASTNINNTVNSVSQKADSNSAKITNLTQVLGTNADGTTAVNDIVHQISDIEQDLEGITTRVGKTEISLKGTYATCSTTAATSNKVATIFPEITDNYELKSGTTITVKFIENNTSSTPTLNVNSSGVKTIKTYSGAPLSEAEYKWDAGATITFIYDGAYWRIQDSTELTRIKNAESNITQTANSITSLVANTATYTAPDGTTQTNTIKSAIQQNTDNINLRVEKSGVIAAINASVETNGTSAVKISADKVNIEGATIFNNGRLSQTSLNNTYASINDIPSDLSDLTDNNNIIPSDMSDLTDNNNIIPSDISNLTDNNSIIPSDISDLTDNNNVIPDISGKADQSSAIAEEQLIYIQAVSGTNSINAYPQTATTTSSYWVTQTGESIPSGTPPNSNTGQTPRWTLKRPSYQKNYPIIFTAKQRKTVSGVITCSTPLKDDTLTIIDGGHITTGTIDASQVTVNNIRADSITVGTINGTQISEGAISFDKLDNNVKNDINTISNAATTALNNLATIENVIDTLTWVTEHGTMTSTTDVTVDPTKIYFVLDNNGDYTVGNNKYSVVQEPSATALSNYYELTIDESIQNYIAAHLSLTNEGLWLTPMAMESDGYKILVAIGGSENNYSTPGTYIISRNNNEDIESIIAQFTGTGISFAQNSPFTIGDSNAYIYFDGNGHINIGGSNVTIGGNTTLQQLLNKYNSTITSNDISVSKSGDTATITIGNNSVNIVDGATGGRWYTGTNITGISTTSKSFSGSGITSAVIGDMYLNTSTYNTYRCTVAGGPSVAKWMYINNIKGTSFTNAEHQYCLSTSTQNAPLQNDSGWNTTPAMYIEGHYYWERWKITLSNPSSIQYTTPVLAQEITSAWAAIEKTNEEINLRATKTEMYQSAQPNLAPIGSVDFSNIYNANTNPNGYWHTALNTQNSWFTQLDDGWIHVYINNSEGVEDINNLNFNPDACPSIIPGNIYTILTEIRNNGSLGTDESNTNFYLNEVDNNQFWGNVQNEQIDDEHVTTTTNVNLLTCGQTNNLYSYRLADVSHIANINEAKVDSGIVGRAIVITDDNSSSQNNNDDASPILFNYVFQCAAGSVLDFDFRMSLYDGIYSGPYKPYSGPQLYSSQAELKVQADRIGMIVANDNAESSLQLTSNALTYIGNNIEIKNSNGTSTVISGGNIQTGSINIGSLDSSVTTPIENAATTATNYISIDTNGGIRIADANSSSRTYQHLTSTGTEFVVDNASKAEFGSSGARIGESSFSHVLVESGAVKVKKNTDVIAHMGFVDGDTVVSSLSSEATIGMPYTLPADLVTLISVDLNGNTLSVSDYAISGGQLTLNPTQDVQDIFAASVDEDGNVIPVYLSITFDRSNGIALAVGGTQAVRPGFESFEQARFSHSSQVFAQHSAASTSAGFRAKRADSTGDVSFIVGSGGVNHGIWSNTLEKWLLHGDNSRMYLNGGRIGLTNNGFEAAGVSSLTFITPNHDSSNTTHWRMVLTDYGNLRLDSSTNNKATWTTVGYYRRTDQGGTFPNTVTIDKHSLVTTTNSINYNTTLSADTRGTGVYLREATGDDDIGYMRSFGRSGPDRLRGVQIGGHNIAAGNNVWNFLYLLTDKDGNRVVQVSERAPWLTALGLNTVGTLVTETPSAVTVPSSSWTTLGSIALTPGVWDISVSTTFAENSAGRRAVFFGTDETGNDIKVGQMGSFIMAPAVGDKTKYSSHHIGSIASNTTYYCRAWQNSGSSLTCQCYLRAVRIK